MRPYDDRQDEAVMGWVKLVVGLALAFGLLMLGVIFAPPASSEMVPDCFPRADLIELLTNKYEEEPIWMGLGNGKSSSDRYVELWGGDQSWSVVTGVQGSEDACIMATGGDWALMPGVEAPRPGLPTEEENP